jgi:hypothetical protein
VPVWVNWDTLERGGRVLVRAGLVGGMVLGAKSLVYGYASPGGNKPLVFSGRLAEQAATRLNETARFVQAVTARGGLRRFADGYAITLKVRLMHAQVRRMILASGRWNVEEWGLPINQHDMMATTFLFSSVLLEGLRQLGLSISAEEGADYMQLWRYVGFLMGVTPELLAVTEAEAWSLSAIIEATQAKPDEDGRALTNALMRAGDSMATTPREKKLADMRGSFGRALSRFLIGDALADGLGLERNEWRHAVPVLVAGVRTSEEVRRRTPGGEARAFDAGARYWRRAVAQGLAGRAADFRPPERLAGQTRMSATTPK